MKLSFLYPIVCIAAIYGWAVLCTSDESWTPFTAEISFLRVTALIGVPLAVVFWILKL